MRPTRNLWRTPRSGGFTMIEILVVIVVIGLLIGLITAVAGRAVRQQKIRNTEQIMQNVTLAIEQFATEDPLRTIYDRKDAVSFGKYPPYQLTGSFPFAPGTVSGILDTNPPTGDYALANRLHRDLGQRAGNVTDWVVIGPETYPLPNINYPDGHDDNRALYAYLKAFSPGSLSLIPEDVLKPLYPHVLPADRSYINTRGSGGTPGVAPDWVDLLGIHDAWGVPLDYMLYVKCEWGLVRNPVTGATTQQYRVVERKPVLRSRGIEREVYDKWVQSDPDPTRRDKTLSPPEKWIFSEELPAPWFGGPKNASSLNTDGSFRFTGAGYNGWGRAVGLAENYAYRPDGDEQP